MGGKTLLRKTRVLVWMMVAATTCLAAEAAGAKKGGYKALFRCWRALESEDATFGQAGAKFGRLTDGVYFLRRGGVYGSVVLFHAKGITSFRLRPRRPPAYVVASVAGKPAFYATYQRDDTTSAIAIEYLAAGSRHARVFTGRRFKLSGSRQGSWAASYLRRRLRRWINEAVGTLELEHERILHETTRLPAWTRIRPGEVTDLLKQRLGRLIDTEACAQIRGRFGRRLAKVVKAFKRVRTLASAYDRSKPLVRTAEGAGNDDPRVLAVKVPLFPGAKVATEKETRCLGLDAWQDDYVVRLGFATATAKDVARFYQKRFGLRPQTTPRGFRLNLGPASATNLLGDHIEVVRKVPAVCARGSYKVRVAVYQRRKGKGA